MIFFFQDMNSCRTSAPCANDGACSYTGPYTYNCTCAANYAGVNCQHGTIVRNKIKTN